IARAVWRDIHEAIAAAGADVDLKGFVLESLRREPLGDLLGIGPRLAHTFLRRVDDTRDHDLPVQRPSRAWIDRAGITFLRPASCVADGRVAMCHEEGVRGDRRAPPRRGG